MSKKLTAWGSIIFLASAALLHPCLASGKDLWEVYKQARERSPLLKARKAVADATSNETGIYLGKLLPSLDVFSSNNVTQIWTQTPFSRITPLGSFSGGANLSQTLFDYGQWHIYKSTQHDSMKAQAQYEYQRQQFMLKVARAYFAVLLAEADKQVAEEQVRATRATLRQTRIQEMVGTKTQSDLEQVRASFYNARAALVKARNDLKSRYYKLSVLTGDKEQGGSLAGLRNSFHAKKPYPLNKQKWVDKAIANNMHLQATRHERHAAESAIEACRGKFFPTISLTASYTYAHNLLITPGAGQPQQTESSGSGIVGNIQDAACLKPTNNLISGGSQGRAPLPIKTGSVQFAYIGISLSWNILSGGADYAALVQGAETYEQARYTTLQTRREVANKTRHDYLAVLTAIEQIKALSQAYEASRSSYQRMLKQYQVGTTTINEVLQQMHITFKNAYRLSKAKFDYITGMLKLKMHAGTLSEGDIHTMNHMLKTS